MHRTRLPRFVMAISALCTAAPGLCADSAPLAQAASPAESCWVGVLGAVARPGVYQFPVSGLQLGSAVRFAGGLSPEATGAMRIVRNGTPGERQAYSPQSGEPLRSGDFVIVESAPTKGFLPPDFRSISAARPSGERQVVYLGLANVLDRPVIVPVPRQHATVLDLLQYLGQAPELLSSVRVVQPASTADPFDAPASGAYLPSDSILIFDRSKLNQSLLPPEFPSAIAIDASELAGLTGPTPQPPPAPAVASEMKLASNEVAAPSTEPPQAAAPTIKQTATAPPSIPPVAAKFPDSAAAAAEKPRRIVDWILGVIALATFIVLAGSLRIWTFLRPKRPTPAAPVVETISRIAPAAIPRVTEPKTAIEPKPAPMPVREPAAPRPRLQLRTLLRNQVPFTEEPCVLPLPLEFYGRPLGTALLRAEKARTTAVASPHFAPVAAGDSDASNRRAAADEGQDTTQATSRRTDASHPFAAAQRPHGVPQADGRPSVLDRVLTRLDGETYR